ncbi:type II toxin-antitoxin system Phd/YefM family antitoxin [Occallatibacter savannae]|uniref:type II toxin-antitoxin system Phd/YefM family antitoxin n=1 Tax=Occallatibacter savannae TaxID=1002691 RepID=UPI000D69A2DA|nr:type II toxin-antitoxin system prevent-host-death family antitoxin [Occallatibacter savannae]
MPTVNVYEAKTRLSQLIDTAASGSDVIIARNGKPVARLTSLEGYSKPCYRLGLLKTENGWLADDFDASLPANILAEFEGE